MYANEFEKDQTLRVWAADALMQAERHLQDAQRLTQKDVSERARQRYVEAQLRAAKAARAAHVLLCTLLGTEPSAEPEEAPQKES